MTDETGKTLKLRDMPFRNWSTIHKRNRRRNGHALTGRINSSGRPPGIGRKAGMYGITPSDSPWGTLDGQIIAAKVI